MENCHTLLGITPAAGMEEIEEAYQRKKLEFGADPSKQQELEIAYNEAVMATFAPIRAFSSPLPPLETQKKAQPQASVGTPLPQPDPQPQASVDAPLPQPDSQPLPVPEIPDPQPPLSAGAPLPQPDSKPHLTPEFTQPQGFEQSTFQSEYKSHTGASISQEARKPVEDTPVRFSDAQLISMDVSELRESYVSQVQDENEEAGPPFLGIENKLQRNYVIIYIGVVVFDIIMRLLVGPAWLVLITVPSPEQMLPTPMPLSIIFAFLSIIYCFICAIPAPFAARFFILQQPPDKNSTMWALFFLGIVGASLLRWLGGLFLPLNISGSVVSFVLVVMSVNFVTLRYEGD